uniref:Uncharacterized protein orf295 n=1 Tax=Chlorokybus atmophyticus TaxID=3144 RepID=A6YEA0_CHLAT|nr:hypothetical protein Chatpmp28 [Chlorokybus atmophyticus]ABO15139.1 hypothetical protein [Chlorokybus atmophyticus]
MANLFSPINFPSSSTRRFLSGLREGSRSGLVRINNTPHLLVAGGVQLRSTFITFTSLSERSSLKKKKRCYHSVFVSYQKVVVSWGHLLPIVCNFSTASSSKKELIIKEANSILNSYSFLLILHISNMKLSEFRQIQDDFFKIDKSLSWKIIKNSLGSYEKRDLSRSSLLIVEQKKEIPQTKTKTKGIDSNCRASSFSANRLNLIPLLQGSTCLLFSNSITTGEPFSSNRYAPVIKRINKEDKILLIGGKIKNTFYNSLDLQKLANLNNSVATQLLSVLQSAYYLYLILKQAGHKE